MPHPITPPADREAFVCLLTLFPPFIPIPIPLLSLNRRRRTNDESIDTHAEFVAFSRGALDDLLSSLLTWVD